MRSEAPAGRVAEPFGKLFDGARWGTSPAGASRYGCSSLGFQECPQRRWRTRPRRPRRQVSSPGWPQSSRWKRLSARRPSSPRPCPRHDLLRTQRHGRSSRASSWRRSRTVRSSSATRRAAGIEVRRLVPVTQAEQVLAADKDPREAYRRVREAGALPLPDPVRTSHRRSRRSPKRWKRCDQPGLDGILRETSTMVEQRHARAPQAARPDPAPFVQLEAVEMRAYLRHLEAGLPPVFTEDALVASIRSGRIAERAMRLGMRSSMGAFRRRGLPAQPGPRWHPGFIGFLIVTHPEALRMVEAIVHRARLPPAAEGNAAVLRSCTDQMIKLVGLFHPERTRTELDSRPPGRRGVAADVRPGGRSSLS